MNYQKFRMGKNNKILRLILSFIVGIWLLSIGDNLHQGGANWLLNPPPAQAQTLRPESVAEQVYEKMPEFPKENQYTGVESNQVEPENTLISRLIRYHQYVKSRPSRYRLDWQLTLADYLGVNEEIKDTRYPGASTLKTNPISGDLQAINQLTRSQRNQLIDLLLIIYNPPKQNAPKSEPTPTPSPSNSAPVIIQPKPGDADLLKF
jgi:hypothetical protein